MNKELQTKIKYPYVLFFHNDPLIETFLNENQEQLDCTIFFVHSVQELNKLFDFSYQILVTYGPEESVFNCESIIADRMRQRWIHFKEIENVHVINSAVNYCFIHNCTLNRTITRPVFSIFTSCYNSYDKIIRVYNSLKNQKLIDYEWVVLDDSPDDEHFKFLRTTFQDDYKVRLYRRSQNSGNIGNVKNEAVSLCRGEYILELDHDDEILPDTLMDSVNYFKENADVGFIYMDFINIYENGNNYWYGNNICKGYGTYYTQKYKNNWVYVYNTPNINNITLGHLTCCPNHPRIWRRSVLLEAGNYCEFLPICDDYEILLRTSLITKMAKISKLGYVQYMNENNNNFSLMRLGEINRIGPYFIRPIFYNLLKINERMETFGACEDLKYTFEHSNIWTRENYTHRIANNKFNYYTKQVCIIGIENIKKAYPITQGYDYILLDTIPLTQLWQILNDLHLTTFKCYSLPTREEMRNYFLMMYKSGKEYEIIETLSLPNTLCLTNQPYLSNQIKEKMQQGYKENYPFPYIILENFLQIEVGRCIQNIVNNLDIKDATYVFSDPTWEKNKYAFEGQLRDKIYDYFVGDEFVDLLEQLTGIKELIRNDTTLKGAGIHKTLNNGFLGMHTDFNMYESKEHGMLDRRINLLLYLNDDWKPEYNGYLSLADFNNKTVIEKIAPTFNKCVIFNTTSKSLHGHPEPLNTPGSFTRNSLAIYYYTKTNKNGLDFEGNKTRPTMIYSVIQNKSLYNTNLNSRHSVINKNTSSSDVYLEIGVEYGQTFNNVHFSDKTGVDPDPKCEGIVKMTSDSFFKSNVKQFDVIFIDGMHQAEYVINDFNNSIKCLNKDGIIFIDDILPLNYNEQLKIPRNGVHENGILKYGGSPWTGDVWKVVYHLLKNYKSYFEFEYYSNENYRGIGIFKIIKPFSMLESEIEIINSYHYAHDFNDYILTFTF